MDKTTLQDILKIGKAAVKKAQKESLKKGVPNVYCKNGKFYFKLPNGNITTEIPEIYREVFKELTIEK